MKTLLERFSDSVQRTDSCWLWTGSCDKDGYGRFKINSRYVRAGRFAYQMAHGSIPDGAQLDHLCRNKPCVKPDHLEPVSNKVNQQRGLWGMRSVCAQGHAYTPANTYFRPNGRRDCRACIRQRVRTYRQRAKVAA